MNQEDENAVCESTDSCPPGTTITPEGDCELPLCDHNHFPYCFGWILSCTDTTWTPDVTTVCSGNTFTQTSNCNNTREAIGTKSMVDGGWDWTGEQTCHSATEYKKLRSCTNPEPSCGGADCVGDAYTIVACEEGETCSDGQCVVSCTDTTWTPDVTTVCSGNTFTQTSNCNNTREATGTKNCCSAIDGGWEWTGIQTCYSSTKYKKFRSCTNPEPSCGGVDCVGNPYVVMTCAEGKVCSDGQCVTSCTPDCDGKVCGTDGCGGSCGTCAAGESCTAAGQCESSCTDTTWTPDTSTVCVGTSVTQTSNCGTVREVDGTKPSVNGGWTAWGEWNCGFSLPGNPSVTRRRGRSCLNPAPSCGGAGCVGDFNETEPCGEGEVCSGGECIITTTYYWDAGNWGTCTLPNPLDNTCNGTETRTVECVRSSDTTVVADSFCTEPKPDVEDDCVVTVEGTLCGEQDGVPMKCFTTGVCTPIWNAGFCEESCRSGYTTYPYECETFPAEYWTNYPQGYPCTTATIDDGECDGAGVCVMSTEFVCGTSQMYDSEGTGYDTVQIGDQCWMEEDMATEKDNQGNTLTEGEYGEYRIEGGHHFYTQNASLEVCPLEWKLPSDSDFKTVEGYLGMSSSDQDMIGWRGNEGNELELAFASDMPGYINSLGWTEGIHYFWTDTYYGASCGNPHDEECYYVRAITNGSFPSGADDQINRSGFETGETEIHPNSFEKLSIRCVQERESDCAATTIDRCVLTDTANGYEGGTCDDEESGLTCKYKCINGVWVSQEENNCQWVLD